MIDKPPAPKDSIGFALHHASFAFKAAMKDRFRAANIGLTPEEFVFLAMVPVEGAALGVLASTALKDKTTITRLVDRLVEKGLVTRQEDPGNRRKQIIYITEAGTNVRGEAIAVATLLTGDATRGIAPEQLEITRQVLQQIIGNLT